MRHDVVEQLSVLAELHDQEQFTFGFDDFVELNNIGVSDLLQYFDFPADPLDVLFVLDARLFQDFDGHLPQLEHERTYFFVGESVHR